jgi:hypothetical protein
MGAITLPSSDVRNFTHLARIPLGWNHPNEKNSRQIINLKHVVVGKVSQLCRNML